MDKKEDAFHFCTLGSSQQQHLNHGKPAVGDQINEKQKVLHLSWAYHNVGRTSWMLHVIVMWREQLSFQLLFF